VTAVGAQCRGSSNQSSSNMRLAGGELAAEDSIVH
jgi:hypothetical protein